MRVVDDADWALGTAELVEVVTGGSRVGSVLELPHHCVQVELLAEQSVELA